MSVDMIDVPAVITMMVTIRPKLILGCEVFSLKVVCADGLTDKKGMRMNV